MRIRGVLGACWRSGWLQKHLPGKEAFPWRHSFTLEGGGQVTGSVLVPRAQAGLLETGRDRSQGPPCLLSTWRVAEAPALCRLIPTGWLR